MRRRSTLSSFLQVSTRLLPCGEVARARRSPKSALQSWTVRPRGAGILAPLGGSLLFVRAFTAPFPGKRVTREKSTSSSRQSSKGLQSVPPGRDAGRASTPHTHHKKGSAEAEPVLFWRRCYCVLLRLTARHRTAARRATARGRLLSRRIARATLSR